MPEEFFLEFFVESLKEDIRHSVNIPNSYTLRQDVEKVRHKKNVIETWNKKGKATWEKG